MAAGENAFDEMFLAVRNMLLPFSAVNQRLWLHEMQTAAMKATVDVGEDLLNEAIKCAPILTGRLIESGTVVLKNRVVVRTKRRSASPRGGSFEGQRVRSARLPRPSRYARAFSVDVGFNVTYAWWLHDAWGGNLGPRSMMKAAAGFPVGPKYLARPLFRNLEKYRRYIKRCYLPWSLFFKVEAKMR